jgi:glucose-1-phosphate thymidylyltransferase
MHALILAAGYGTRLHPLTERVAKPLLPLAGRPMLDYVFDRIREVDEVGAVHVVTNSRFAASFREWAGSRDVEVHDDGTRTEDDRLGAIGDIQFVVDRAELGKQELLVVAGDNLFDYSLSDFVRWWHGKGEASVDCGCSGFSTNETTRSSSPSWTTPEGDASSRLPTSCRATALASPLPCHQRT